MKRHSRTTRRTSAIPRRVTVPSCKHFTGYKPCFPDSKCYEQCADFDPVGKKILIVNLDAMGNVLVTTSLLPAIKRKFPSSSIYWITLKNAAPLLQNIPLLDRVYVWDPESWLVLQQMKFDLVLSVDKSQRSCAFVDSLHSAEKLGFGLNAHGQIVPLNKEAYYNYRMGLDDNLKFRINTKTVQQIQCEQFKLKYARDEYTIQLSSEEVEYCASYKRANGLDDGAVVVGFNTGCSELYPNKKMSVEQHVGLINRLAGNRRLKLVLLGGPEDTERNAQIERAVGLKVHNTPTTEGVRRGLCYINLCDIVISGDSFGMHASIGLRKHVIVWFGVSCSTEIDLYGRGTKLIPEGLDCSPCWKRTCPYNLECIQMVDLERMATLVDEFAASASRQR